MLLLRGSNQTTVKDSSVGFSASDMHNPHKNRQALVWPGSMSSSVLLRAQQDIVNLRKYASDEFSHLHVVLAELCKVLAGKMHDSFLHFLWSALTL